MSESKRLIDLLSATDEFFKTRGIDSPRRNAEALFAKALQLPRIELYLQHDRPLKDYELDQIRDLIRRRAKREPLQYLVGEVEFCNARIGLTPGLLIPRPETEELVSTLIERIPANSRILDIGCGTGCISVALSKNLEKCSVVAIDKDPDAVVQTKSNAELNEVSDRVSSLVVDLYSGSLPQEANAPFNVVVSNPPYLRTDELPSLEPEVKDHERPHALAAGVKGDECFVRIAELIPDILNSSGILALEFGIHQENRVRELFEPVLTELTIYRDIQGKERFLIGKR
ncbi:MAG: peptide chain release factor N(5)-glutamine methyltransferase [bacterium]|nr:peptide chain release factor N(5)-glutamine methyltransferase [bacterium]